MSVSAEWIRGFVESFVESYIDNRFPDLLARVAKLETSKPSLTDDGRIVVSANEYARLERVDKAARRVVEDADDCGVERRLLAELDLAVKGIWK